ncbi:MULTISPECIES: DUF2332 family protein [unclassified Curtobacterium]|uniref:DUF2332 family protein n=1 Tax=unclassified Curtobacterium TaxID=257496 RepID=UPI00226B4047|nr:MULTISPECIES: DUF2332 family protein [unclassified Curtobacterium]
MSTPPPSTRERYAAYADRIADVSPTYAAWARSLDDDLVALLDTVPPTQRQPELVFAVARGLGADPSDPAALRALGQEARPALVAALTTATMQANDPRRLAPLVPVIAALAARTARSLGLVDVGAAASLCSFPDRVTLDLRVHDAGVGRGEEHRLVRTHTAPAEPSLRLTADAWGTVPSPSTAAIRVAGRVALDPHPVDLRVPGAFDRLVQAVPPEATDRTALMREAARVTLAEPPVRITGRVPDDLDRALDALPADCEPVVMTAGTLVYVPGAGRQRFVDRVAERGVHWVALERTGILAGVASTLPDGIDPTDPASFATVSLDGVALAVCDAFGTATRWFRDPSL